MRPSLSVAIAISLTAASAGMATDLRFPDRGRAAVVDAAKVMPDAASSDLNRQIVAWNKATGHQLVVATVPSLQGVTIAEYGYLLGRNWRLGRKGINDGIILLLAPAERKVRIEVGRGLEGDLTDAETSVILSRVVTPKLKAGDTVGALKAGAEAIMAAVPAAAGDVANAPTVSQHSLWWPLAIIASIFAFASLGMIILGRAAQRRKEERDESCRQAELRRQSRIATPRPPSGAFSAPLYHSPAREPERSAVIVPVIVNASTYQAPARRDDTSWGSSGSSSFSDSSSSSTDWGSSSSGFDSGGGDFGGGGSDSSY
jgi:uncharacterized protein